MELEIEYYIEKYNDELLSKGLALSTIENYIGIIREFLVFSKTVLVTKEIKEGYLSKQIKKVEKRTLYKKNNVIKKFYEYIIS
ncbi:TPA: hypothetical protein LEO40_001380, partial [Listeria monocytogenes]|nr:hypothetical protein [Listeria monocytogenes]